MAKRSYSNVAQAADEIRASYDDLEPGDQKRVCVFLRKIRRRTSERAILAKAERELKPKSPNWENLLAFIQKLMPLILAMISKA